MEIELKRLPLWVVNDTILIFLYYYILYLYYMAIIILQIYQHN